MRLSRKKSTVLPKDEEGSVPLSRTVNVINYQSNINLKKYLKDKTSVAENEKEHSVSSATSSNIAVKRKQTENLVFLHRFSNKRMTMAMDQDVALCSVYGYKNVGDSR